MRSEAGKPARHARTAQNLAPHPVNTAMPENRHPIPVYLPYLAGTADERQYRVMTDRESWFRIVMGQEEVARIIPNEEEGLNSQPPRAFQEDLVFRAGIKWTCSW